MLCVPSNNILYIYVQAGRKIECFIIKIFAGTQFILTMNDPDQLKIT